jgi:polyprenyl-phospho-N-acetylgalactosaminyl synthase
MATQEVASDRGLLPVALGTNVPFGSLFGAGVRCVVKPMPDKPSTSIWLIIPAKNEAPVIGRVVADLTVRGFTVVVVDDGSTDETGVKAGAAGAIVVTHPINLGQGAALQTGLRFALHRGADYIVTFDADGQHRAADIDGLIDSLTTNNADFALGSRFLGGALAMPMSRRLLLMAATWFTRLTTGLKISDTHNGLRAMTRRGASRIRLRQNRMAHASELLHEIARSGLRYVEVPVTIEYSQYSLAKGQRLSDSLRILVDLSAQRLHR